MANWLIAGLGNPGSQYAQTRHNAGFWWLDRLAEEQNVSLSIETKFHGQFGQTSLAGHRLYLLKPHGFMNRSGQAVAALARFYKIAPDHILIVHDDLDLPAGKAKLKSGGGHGGHNGLRDIIAQLGSQAFLRCRIGIGHPGDRRDVSHYVLSKPALQDQPLIHTAIEQSIQVLPDILSGKMDKAMNWLHSQ